MLVEVEAKIETYGLPPSISLQKHKLTETERCRATATLTPPHQWRAAVDCSQ